MIILPYEDKDGKCTRDAKKYKKDCCEFVCLRDGTLIGECRYCDLSLICRQVDVLPNGEVVPMEAHYLPVYDSNDELVSFELFCTGMHDLRPLKERIEDDKVS